MASSYSSGSYDYYNDNSMARHTLNVSHWKNSSNEYNALETK